MVARKAAHLSGFNTPDGYDKANRYKLGPFWRPAGRISDRFVWTDKGERSFRGLYRSDPAIDAWSRTLSEVEQFIANRTGFDGIYNATRPLHSAIRNWSLASADAMNRDLPETPTEKNVPKK